jgi:hypothetical protein
MNLNSGAMKIPVTAIFQFKAGRATAAQFSSPDVFWRLTAGPLSRFTFRQEKHRE